MSADNSAPDLAEQTVTFDPQHVLCQLNDSGDQLPVDAILDAREHREVMIPLLIQSIEDATSFIRESGKGPEGNLHFYALFLLAEFRATEAWYAIVESISLPGDQSQDLYGDAITEALGRILAVLVGDSSDRLDQLIADESVDSFVREQGISAYLYLIKDGILTREAAIERLRPRIEEELEREESEFTTYLLNSLIDFAPSELAEEMLQIFDRSDIDPYVVIREDLTESFERDTEEVMQEIESLRPAGIADTIEELSKWSWFDGESDEDKWDDAEITDADREEWERAKQYVMEHELAGLMPDDEPHINTIRNESPRVGRNDPCPCGSGKKHKKCCWSS